MGASSHPGERGVIVRISKLDGSAEICAGSGVRLLEVLASAARLVPTSAALAGMGGAATAPVHLDADVVDGECEAQ